MDWVPRPTGVKPNPKWALKQIRKIARRLLKENPDIYLACRNQVANTWATRYDEILYLGY